MRLAVLGGGFLGVCVALECVRRGVEVDLYERRPELITQAGVVNEGKIHLGYVYAVDTSLRTAERLMSGGLMFSRHLDRWLDLTARPLELSEPFHYAVPRDSRLSLEAITGYFARIARLYEEISDSLGVRYLDRPHGPFFSPLSDTQIAEHYHPASLSACFATIERSVDARRLAERLRAVVRSQPEIHLRTGCTVTAVRRARPAVWEVDFDRDGSRHCDGHDVVVNCLWDGRLAIDAGLGLVPRRPWLYRYKFGVRLKLAPWMRRPPTVTLVHGAFGDVVDFPSGEIFLSWYPSGMVGTCSELVPPDWGARYDRDARRGICRDSLTALGRLCPALDDLPESIVDAASVRGGSIFAWGATDIHDRQSELHRRFDIGITSEGSYHSIDPGKYTMVPAYAVAVCDRIGL